MKVNLPLVSVLMTTYNREKYIVEAIESVLKQTYSNWELIIVDDVSLDNTVAIATSFALKDHRIKVYLNNSNLGDYSNRNQAASLAKGEYLKYLDADDMMYPWCLDAMVYCMQQFPDAAYGLISPSHINLEKKYPIFYTPKEAYTTYYFKDPILIIGPTGSIIRATCFHNENGFSGRPYIGDTELWLKLSAKNPMIVMPPDLIWWRKHDEQQSAYESKNSQAKKMRYDLVVNSLLDENCPIDQKLVHIALRNQKNILIRQLITRYLEKFDLKNFISKIKEYDFSIEDIIRALKKNKNPFSV